MKKNYILLILISLAFAFNTNAQDKYITKTGHVWFYSKTDVKEIEAHNKQVTSIIDIKTGEVIVSAFLRDFKFDNQLVEEHFNENYIHSHEYPKVKFKGSIANISSFDLTKDGTYECEIVGTIEMHGKVKNHKEKGTAIVKDGKIYADSKFFITAADFAIIIPEIVIDKIAKEIAINVEFVYEVYTKK